MTGEPVGRVPDGTHRFSFVTPAGPGDVWVRLTGPDAVPSFVHGLAVSSSWEVGAPVELRDPGCGPGGDVLTGRVLCVQPASRLSFYFRSGPHDPSTYLTWTLRPSPAGTVVGLQVDHVGYAETPVDAEDTWLPVLAALQAQVAPRALGPGSAHPRSAVPRRRAPGAK